MRCNYGILVGALGAMRERGIRVAIDDVGAGFASLRHILSIEPDIIKLDVSLVRGIDSDPRRHALANALVTFAEEIGMFDRFREISVRIDGRSIIGPGESAPGSVWFHDIVPPCLGTSCRPQDEGVGDVAGEARGHGG